MSILSVDGLAKEVAACRRLVNDQDACATEAAVVDLAAENDRLRAERDECVALIQKMLDNDPCAEDAEKMLAKLRTP